MCTYVHTFEHEHTYNSEILNIKVWIIGCMVKPSPMSSVSSSHLFIKEVLGLFTMVSLDWKNGVKLKLDES